MNQMRMVGLAENQSSLTLELGHFASTRFHPQIPRRDTSQPRLPRLSAQFLASFFHSEELYQNFGHPQILLNSKAFQKKNTSWTVS